MRTITITSYASMPGQYRVMTNDRRSMQRDARDPGDAAAVAINYANASHEPYVIVGHRDALAFIPEQVRSRLA